MDNGSSDDYDIQDYVKKEIAEVWVNPKKHAQVELTNHYLQKAKKYNWVLVVDLDEFMYARNGYKTIKEYLRTIKPEVDQIKVPWKMFGSSGHIKQPKSIIQGFTRRRKYIHSKLNPLVMFVKSLVRGKSLHKIGIHSHITSAPNVIIPTNQPSCNDIEPVSEEIIETSYLNLNHYGIQSWNFFKVVKMSRGSASTKKNDKVRDKSYFKLRDTNEFVDTELKQKRLKDGAHRIRSHRFKTVRRRRVY